MLFVYELGLQVGPGFFSSFRKGGVQLNMLRVEALARLISGDHVTELSLANAREMLGRNAEK